MSVLTVPFHLDERLDPSRLLFSPYHTVDPDLPAGTAWQRMAVLYEHLATAVSRAQRPTVLSGDCTSALGVLAGLQRTGVDPAVVWFDAHGDFNTEETSDSGYLGGMPLALATGRGDATVRDRIGLSPIAEEDIVLGGARSLDPRERTALEATAVRRVPVEAVPREASPDRPLYVHIDLDVLDPSELGGVAFPVPGGSTLDELAESLSGLAMRHRIAAASLGCGWDADRFECAEASRAITVVREALDSPLTT